MDFEDKCTMILKLKTFRGKVFHSQMFGAFMKFNKISWKYALKNAFWDIC